MNANNYFNDQGGAPGHSSTPTSGLTRSVDQLKKDENVLLRRLRGIADCITDKRHR